MPTDTIGILDGSTFLLSDRNGDVEASRDRLHGFFYRDTRFLSRWTLQADGARLHARSTDDLSYFAAQFFLVPPTGDVNSNPTASLIRKRAIGDGFHEDVSVLDHGADSLELELRLDTDSDFADLFEVKDALAQKGDTYRRVEGDTLVLDYRRGDFVRETRIRASRPELDEQGLTFRIVVAAQADWNTCIFVQPVVDRAIEIEYRHDDEEAKPNIGMSLAQWLDGAPKLESDWDPLEHIYERSLVDLAALRFTSELFPGAALPAAGLPWFMTVFGRDSLITSYQALPFAPELAETTLRVLAARQATEVDAFRDAEPWDSIRFWLPERNCYALALDGEKRAVDSITSNVGHRRGRTGFPVEYQTASSPQAWATGTPLLLLRALLGLEADADGLTVDPHLGDGIVQIALKGIPGRWGQAEAAGTRMEEAWA